MDTPTRRDLFKYAAGATLASALPLSAQTHGDPTLMPLVVDLIGPMAFRKVKSQKIVDVWLPLLLEHEAGIGTSVTSKPLSKDDYTITGTTPSNGDPTPHPTSNCTVYPGGTPPLGYLATNRFIHLTLPMPQSIVALNPVRARVSQFGSTPSGFYSPYAVGLRFLYPLAGTPILTPPGGAAGVIPFEPATDEIEVNISIGYAPNKYTSGHAEAKAAFTALSLLFFNSPGLQVDFEAPLMEKSASKDPTLKLDAFGGPLHNCRAPIILLN